MQKQTDRMITGNIRIFWGLTIHYVIEYHNGNVMSKKTVTYMYIQHLLSKLD